MKKILYFTIFLVLSFYNIQNVEAERIHTTGFESMASTSEGFIQTFTSNPLEFSAVIKRTGNASAKTNATMTSGEKNGSQIALPSSIASTTTRFYLYISEYPDVDTSIFAVTTGSAVRGTLRLSTTGILELLGGGSLVGSTTTPLELERWYRIEVKYHVVRDGVAFAEAKVEGVTFGSASDVDLGTTLSQIWFGANLAATPEAATSGEWYFDDVAINDPTGSTQNDYPGEGKVVNMLPNAAGDSTQGSSISGGNGWDDLDEVVTDYNTTGWQMSSTNNTLDVNVQSPTEVGIKPADTITVVHVNTMVRNTGTAASSVAWRIKSGAGGTTTMTSTNAITTVAYVLNDDGSNKTSRIVSETEPQGGGAWTPALLETMQIGIRATDANPAVTVTQMWATVEYIPFPPLHRVNFLNGRIKFTNGRILFR